MELFSAFLVFSSVVVLTCFSSEAAFFVFGDSLVDSGNNDFLITTARADAYPYGIDSPSHTPSGRFSNGYNLPDLISQQIGGEESPLPYLSPQLGGERLLVGANFASAGIGILNDTGVQFVSSLKIFYSYLVASLIGEEQTKQLVNQALFLITLGGNDFVNNYFLVPCSARSRQYALEDYVPYIISEYRKILLRLVELGARKVLVTGTGPIGCVPAELAQHSTNGECVPELQQAAALFNTQLGQMINQLNSELGQPVFIGGNLNEMHFDLIDNPQQYGFVTSKMACCGQGPYNGIGLCTPASNLCPSRDEYVFWDGFHPCERANRILVQMIMTGAEKYMSPMNLSTMMKLDDFSRT
ncbi:hypothetical protein QQ045_005405 [Rhodiola kirilowii]